MTATGARYHALDAMRAAMMMLGLVLHSMAGYMVAEPGDAWPFRDDQRHVAFDVAVYVIHLFRMPAFFAVAGFFAALLYERDGLGGFIRNRARRVLLPLVLFWAAIGALVLGAFYFAITRSGQMTGDALLAATAREFRLRDLSPMHLWFLWYLVIFYGVAAALGRAAGSRVRVSMAGAQTLTTGRYALPFWGAVSTLTLLPMPADGILASPVILADPRTLSAYGVFFVFGWLLYRGRGGLTDLRRWWSAGTLFLLAGVAVLSYLFSVAGAGPEAAFLARRLSVALAIWILTLAAFGAFLRHASRERPAVRYFSDASYWSYIVHLPIVVFTAGVVAPFALPSWLKFSIVLSITTMACLGTYALFVRHTWIGAMLNGRRVPRTVPHAWPAPQA